MPLMLGRSFLVSTRRSRENEKSTPLRHFFNSEKGVEWCLQFCNRWKFLFAEFWDESFCLLSSAALSEFLMYWWFIEWYSTKPRYRFASKPATLAKFMSTKKSSPISWSTKSALWTKFFLRTSTTYERCRGSWGHSELHKKDSPSDFRAIV